MSHIGIGGVCTSQNDPSGKTGILVMGFITPEYRGQGLSHFLYQTRIDWAHSHPLIERLEASHRKNNDASRKSMIKHGFQPTGKQRIRFGNDEEDTDCQYVLNLEK
jgi:RimJ/RimL family protein N-acetyltransferase